MGKNKHHKYTEEQKSFILNNYKGILTKDLAALFNLQFNTTLTNNQLRSFKHNYKLSSGVVTRYIKGNIPYFKGTKGLAKANKTSFKKGQKPYNYLPIGTEVIDSDGYHKVKVDDPNKWLFKHRMIYQKHHGEIPKGTNIIFLDQDRNNLDINNLDCITDSELFICNQKKLISEDPQFSTSGVLIAKTLSKVFKLEKSVT